jgi:hypothetical protein
MSTKKWVAIQFMLGRPKSLLSGGATAIIRLSYFNVSIEPNAEGLDLIPLIEERRAITTIAPSGDVRQPMLILTLRNNNDFDVPFFANHILVTG